jgi:hypothetical protein
MARRAFSIGAAVVLATFYPGICSADDGIVAHQQSAMPPFDGNGVDVSTSGEEDLPVAHERDSIHTGSIGVHSVLGAWRSTDGLASGGMPLCPDIKAPPTRLQTQSKYSSDDLSKSSVDDEAMAERDKAVRPIRGSVRILTNMAYGQSVNRDVMQARADCVLGNLDRWAIALSLTDMSSEDAFLTRDRWIAEIALALEFASKNVELSAERKERYSAWLGTIARDTIDAYAFRLGPKSRTNNHRYWAGLSVAAVGFLLGDQEFKRWGRISFEIGACQVDKSGYLPRELERGEKALEYHVYALRPLAAILKLALENGEPIQSKCLDGYERLSAQTRGSLKDASVFERAVGLRQKTSIRESSYSEALKLSSLKIGTD